MANTGAADSTGSQFFIMTKDSTSGLGKTYTVIGTVSAGMPIIQKVAAAGETDTSSSSPGDGAPKLPIKFTSMTVAK
jgi:peptidyl-prolyl cis-trans isomerase B (cyclophilin B)